MRPVRFVALSEDGQALVLADEVGRLLALPIDERVSTGAARRARRRIRPRSPWRCRPASRRRLLAPRDIQARIRVRRVRRGRGPHRRRAGRPGAALRRPGAAGAGDARPARPPHPAAHLRQGRLARRGRRRPAGPARHRHREDLLGRLPARRRHLARSSPPGRRGKATAQAVWELDKARQVVTPHDDMAQYLCAERPAPILGQEPAPERTRPRPARPVARRAGPRRPRPAGAAARRRPRPGRDPIRAGRDALLASLDRPLGGAGRRLDPAAGRAAAGRRRRPARPAARRRCSAAAPAPPSTTTRDAPKEVPAVPSLAVLRPAAHRRPTATGEPATRRQAAQAPAELGRRALRRRPGRPRVA